MINTFERLNGEHPGFRRNHAKGVCADGYFNSNGAGQALSKVLFFRAGRVPILGRFALAGGSRTPRHAANRAEPGEFFSW